MSGGDPNRAGRAGFLRAREMASLAPPGHDPMAFALLPERERLDAIRDSGRVPGRCGPAYPVAPARGAFEVVDFVGIVPGSDGRIRDTGFRGQGEGRARSTVRVGDAFTVMEEQARRAAGRARRSFVEPFTPGQVAAGRLYGALVQRLAASGLSCASVEAMAGRGTGPGGDVSEARLDDARRVAAMRRRIGTGVAIAIRRVRPSARADGAPRRLIRTLDLVDAVCVDDLTLSGVLARHGWSLRGATVVALRVALAEALDRCAGCRA